jgi:4'-phosphopantetheinyl transferase
MAIVAVSRNRVGVDIERLRSMDACDAIARTTFSSSEYLAQARLPSDIRQRAFFQCWTRKEAVVKALGGGLSIPLDSFEVTVEPDVPARVVRFAGWTRPQWSLLHLAPTAEIIGAVAAPYEVRSVEATLLDG